MNKKNFDSVQNYSVPQEWVNKAKNIPNTVQKTAPIYVNFKKITVAVASVMLVCCVSLIVFLMKPDNANPPVSDVIETKSTVSVTDSSNISDSTSNSETQSQKSTEKSQKSTLPHSNSQSQEPEKEKPTLEIEPSEAPTSAPTFAPTQGNTNPDPTDDRDDPLRPTPTDGIVDPSETLTPENPSDTTVPPTQKPTDSENYNTYISLSVKNQTLTGSGNVYCMTYFNGEICGDSELFSKQHEVQISFTNNMITTVRYYPYRQGVIANNGLYEFRFYNEDGTVIAVASDNF